MARVWRICRKQHAAFDGEGARLTGGRWNLKGTALVYTSGSLSLAALEMLVHLDVADAPEDLVAIAAKIPADLEVKTLSETQLPRRWRSFPAPEELAKLGTRWVESSETAVLAVPSVLVPQESNYLLNPRHPAFSRIRVEASGRFRFDPRLFREKGSKSKKK